jgi:hypothetical protein
MTDGKGGFDPGRLVLEFERVVPQSDLVGILGIFDPQHEFWAMTPTAMPVGTDGAQWIVEVADGSRYHVVDRQSPGAGLISGMGRRLIELSRQNFGAIY